MVQHNCGFSDSSPSDFWMMSCWSFPWKVVTAGILEENQYLHLFLLKTYISLYKVVKCCGFFCQFGYTSHSRYHPLNEELIKAVPAQQQKNPDFWRRVKENSSFLLKSPALRTDCYEVIWSCLLLGLDEWYLGMVVMFCFTIGVLRSTSQSFCGVEPVPEEPCWCVMV